MKEKLAQAISRRSEAEVAGVSTSPSIRLLIAAAVVSLVVVGAVTLFFVLFRPMDKEAIVELSKEEKPVEAGTIEPEPPEEKGVDEPTA